MYVRVRRPTSTWAPPPPPPLILQYVLLCSLSSLAQCPSEYASLLVSKALTSLDASELQPCPTRIKVARSPLPCARPTSLLPSPSPPTPPLPPRRTCCPRLSLVNTDSSIESLLMYCRCYRYSRPLDSLRYIDRFASLYFDVILS